jgi:IclR family acetate operon transcriptional repressor
MANETFPLRSEDSKIRAEHLPAPSLERGLKIVEALVLSKQGMRLSQIALRFGLGKSTTFRILRTLKEMGYVCCIEDDHRYFATSKLLSLGRSASLTLRSHNRALPFLKNLRKNTDLTVQLSALEDRELVVVEKLGIASTHQVASWVGKRSAMHATAMGKAVLAFLPEGEMERIIRSHGMQRFNANTIVSLAQLKRHLQEIRYRGFACDNEESELGVRSVAAPVFDRFASAAGAVSVAGTTEQITSNNLTGLAEKVKQTAEEIRNSLPMCFTAAPAV